MQWKNFASPVNRCTHTHTQIHDVGVGIVALLAVVGHVQMIGVGIALAIVDGTFLALLLHFLRRRQERIDAFDLVEIRPKAAGEADIMPRRTLEKPSAPTETLPSAPVADLEK